MELYSELGDNIALQYGGSEAHKKVSGSSGPGKQVRRQLSHGARFPPEPPPILELAIFRLASCSIYHISTV